MKTVIPITFPSSDFPTHTPELLALFDAMNDTRSKLNRALAAGRCAAFRLPEYKASMTAYRAYWRAVDADKTAGGLTVEQSDAIHP